MSEVGPISAEQQQELIERLSRENHRLGDRVKELERHASQPQDEAVWEAKLARKATEDVHTLLFTVADSLEDLTSMVKKVEADHLEDLTVLVERVERIVSKAAVNTERTLNIVHAAIEDLKGLLGSVKRPSRYDD